MALDQEFYMLQNLTSDVGGELLHITNLTVKRNPVYADRTGGATVQSQVYVKENVPDIMVEFFNTSDRNFADIIPNTAVTSFDVTSDSDGDLTLFQTDFFTKFPVSGMTWGAVETGFDGENPSKCRVPIVCNVLNPD